MNLKTCFIILSTLALFSCSKKPAVVHTTPPPVTPPNSQHVSVFTQRNNNTRAGLNNQETKLTTTTVNTGQFGKLFTLSVDDQVYAQPLVVGSVAISHITHNIVYVATVNNSVYAFDGDDGTLYWNKNYSAPGMRAPKNTDMTGACGGQYMDFSGNIGIVGTPVVDSVSQTMYFVARSTDQAGTTFVQYLHAINIINGSEQSNSPTLITAKTAGTGDGSLGGQVLFDPQRNNQRQALTLVNGVVYVTFSSHCDWGPYHGWILGYDAKSLQQQIVYNDTPDGGDGGIWESGNGMAADNLGNIYTVTGNGTVGTTTDPTNPRNRGESALKLSVSGSTLAIQSYFTPTNFQNLENNDLDYGVSGAFLIPNSNYYFTAAKDGNIYLLDKDNMGGYSGGGNQVQQNIPLNGNANMHCQPAYYKGPGGEYVYVWSENDELHAFPFNRGTNMFDAGNQKVSNLSGPLGQNGAMLAVSSNGTTAGTGILWAAYAKSGDAEHTVSTGILRAFDANDVSKELWNSDQNTADAVGNYAKFSTPTIVDGHVYLATFSNKVVVYGLK